MYFSVIIPTYNRVTLLNDTIKTLLNQEYQDWEALIIDDGGSDSTEELIKSYNDKRIKYFYKEHGERAKARNFGIAKSKGNYITFLDSDDKLYPNFLHQATLLINKQSFPEWFHLGYEVRSGKKILWRVNNRTGNLNKELIKGNQLSCFGVFLRKDIARENHFDESKDLIGSEDYELWLRIASKYQLNYSNTVTGYLYNHSGRSILDPNSVESLEVRVKTLINKVTSNPRTYDFVKPYWGRFLSHRYLYLSLHLAISKMSSESRNHACKAIKIYPSVLFSKKFISIARLLVKNSFA